MSRTIEGSVTLGKTRRGGYGTKGGGGSGRRTGGKCVSQGEEGEARLPIDVGPSMGVTGKAYSTRSEGPKIVSVHQSTKDIPKAVNKHYVWGSPRRGWEIGGERGGTAVKKHCGAY